MRKVLLYLIVSLVIYFPIPSHAVSEVPMYEALLHQLITLLNEQVRLLSSTPRAETTTFRTVPHESELMNSQFYDGPYIALYVANGRTLSSVRTNEYHYAHERLWNHVVNLLGDDYALAHVRELRIYSSNRAEFDAFTERDEKTGEWILGVNVYGLDLSRKESYEEIDELLIHEIGHMRADDHAFLIDDFTQTFWDDTSLTYAKRIQTLPYGDTRDELIRYQYGANEDDFVSEYAATSPLEDFVESYVHYVLSGSPIDSSVKSNKVNYFSVLSWAYEDKERMSTILGK